MRAGAHYLERYASSAENFRRVLERKVRRRAAARDEEAGVHGVLVAEVVERFRDLGFLDDAAYAEARLRSLRRKGTSTRMARMKLAEKGVEGETIAATIAEDETSERAAALAYARRRRLGPFRLRGRAERRDRDIAAMARAGFPVPLAIAIVEASAETLEADEDG